MEKKMIRVSEFMASAYYSQS